MTIHGVLPVIQMPYFDDESIDYGTLEKEVDWLFQCGADGVVFAMVSEFLRLSTHEQREVARNLIRWSAQRWPQDSGTVVISVGAESTFVACENARQAEQMGAHAVMAIPPIATSAESCELHRYYEAILNATRIPVIIQDASGYIGNPLPIALQANLYKDFGPERVLFKPEAPPIGPRLSQLRDATDAGAAIFEGTGGIALVDSFRRGISGTMPGCDLIKSIIRLYQALINEEESVVYKLSLPISSIIAMQHNLDAFLAIEKYLLHRQGIFQNTNTRGPVAYRLDQETKHEIDRLFDKLELALEAI